MTANVHTLKTQILIELAHRPNASAKMLAMALAKPQAKVSKALRELEGDEGVVALHGPNGRGLFFRLPTPPTADTRTMTATPPAQRAKTWTGCAGPTNADRALEVLQVMGASTSPDVATLTGLTRRQASAALIWLVDTKRAVVEKTDPKAHRYTAAK